MSDFFFGAGDFLFRHARELSLSHARAVSRVWLVGLVMASLFMAPVSQAREDGWIEKKRALFVEVESALKAGNRGPFKRHRETLATYPLYPYLVSRDLQGRLARVGEREMAGFLEAYGGTVPVAEKLRHRWLAQLARRGRWGRFLEHYRESVTVENKGNRCSHAFALIRSGRARQAEEQVRALWLVDFSQPPQCDLVFKWGFDQGVLTDDLVWDRALLAWGRGRVGLTDYLGGKLKGDARRWFNSLKQARYHPERTALEMRRQMGASPYAGDVMTFALRRLIRKDIAGAGAVWSRIKRGCGACLGLRTVEKEIGIAAARRLMPAEAYRWLSQLPPEYRDDESRYWRIRAALRMQAWKRVLASIDDLQGGGRSFFQWRYWRAHALSSLGRRDEAHQIWGRLSQQDDYYGYLSADRLGKSYSHSWVPLEFTEAEMAALDAYPAVARIRELLILDRPFDASRELLVLLEYLGARTKLKLAVAAGRWQWPIGAIRSIASSREGGGADDTVSLHFLQRFPTPYREIIEAESRRNEVPVEWIYGVMRRESAFVERIKSPAGALGLMQLRLSTAQAVASRLGLGKVSSRRVLLPKINVRLGAAYIRQLYRKSGGNFAVSLAGYNAGPTNARRWLKNAPVDDAAVWIDTIPIDETRLYVRAVLFYALVYRHRLGKPQMRLRELIKF